jgi:phage gp46-like protein
MSSASFRTASGLTTILTFTLLGFRVSRGSRVYWDDSTKIPVFEPGDKAYLEDNP